MCHPYSGSGFPGGAAVKNLPAVQEKQVRQVQSLGGEDPLEEEMATPSSIAWEIPWGRKAQSLSLLPST